MTETEAARRYIVPVLKARFPDLYLEKIPGSPFKKGLPDYVFCLRGVGGVIECKMHDNREPSPLQLKHLRDITRAGGVGVLLIIEQNRKITCRTVKASKTATLLASALACSVEPL